MSSLLLARPAESGDVERVANASGDIGCRSGSRHWKWRDCVGGFSFPLNRQPLP